MSERKKLARVYVEITNICNKSCSFCIGTHRKMGRMTLEQFDTVTDKLIGITDYLYLHLMGEPLSHPEIAEFIRLAVKKGFKVAVTTNGTLLALRGSELIDAGVYKVNISLHSFEGDDKCAKEKYLTECIEFADLASARGVLTVFRLWNSEYAGGENFDTVAALKQYFKDGEWIFSKRGARIRDKLHLEWGERFEWPDITRTDTRERVFCYGLADHFAVLCDGTVVPCCLDSDGNIPLGNIFEGNVEQILTSERAEKIRTGFCERRASEELCRRCGYARRFKV